jgi:hypothetical protein
MPRVLPWLKGDQSTTVQARPPISPHSKRSKLFEPSSDIDESSIGHMAAMATPGTRGKIMIEFLKSSLADSPSA